MAGWCSGSSGVVQSQQRGDVLHVVNSYSRERASSADLGFESMRPSFHMLRRRNHTRSQQIGISKGCACFLSAF